MLVSLALGLTSCASAVPAGSERVARPNLVFLLSDDQRWDTLGCMGNPVIRTPHLDQLAQDGVLFRNAFVTTSVCSVSRASILTGSYARGRGVGDLSRLATPDDPTATWPALLRHLGYQTGHIGKWDVGIGETGFQWGARLFDFWAGDRFHGNYWHESDCGLVRAVGWHSKTEVRCNCPPEGSLPRVGHAGMKLPRHFDQEIVPLKVKEFLRGRDPVKPFCLSVSFRSPKDPWSDHPENVAHLYQGMNLPAPPTATPAAAARQPAFLHKSMGSEHGRRLAGNPEALAAEMRRYYRQISSLDAAIGKIRQLLAAEGVAENTVLMFTSDNGHFLGERGFWGKWLPYEPSIRVPLVIFDPRLSAKQRGRVCDEMVLNIDLAPTLLALAGDRTPSAMQGKDLTPLLCGEHPAWRSDWLYEHTWTAEGRIVPSEAVRSREWKFIRYPGETPVVEQLFNLRTDADETQDRIGDPDCADVVQLMRGKLEAYRRDLSVRPCRPYYSCPPSPSRAWEPRGPCTRWRMAFRS
jgi:arylsulfatase A-like enzyme